MELQAAAEAAAVQIDGTGMLQMQFMELGHGDSLIYQNWVEVARFFIRQRTHIHPVKLECE
jgi:hypothetical protein